MATFLDLPEALHQHVAFHLLLLDEPIMAMYVPLLPQGLRLANYLHRAAQAIDDRRRWQRFQGGGGTEYMDRQSSKRPQQTSQPFRW